MNIGERIKFGRFMVRLRRQDERGNSVTVRVFDVWKTDTTESEDDEEYDYDTPSDSDTQTESDYDTDYDSDESFSDLEAKWLAEQQEGEPDDAGPLTFAKRDRDRPSEGTHVRVVYQLHCTQWPDFGVPNSTEVMKTLLKEVDIRKKGLKDAICVHCSAGIGRTGTFVSIHTSLQKALHGEQIDIKNTVLHLRTQRIGMVQSKEQYVFVHAVVEDVLRDKEENNGGPLRRRRPTRANSCIDKPDFPKELAAEIQAFSESVSKRRLLRRKTAPGHLLDKRLSKNMVYHSRNKTVS
eukprot:CAMPEP_0168515836 /NCGR_PEP_ID=MMETSP0405-20121227/5037_1 /TAXON_ID=498012 /ORGANISM="Trichosphaerium sp, Strain Am-I-7 wt" /LENGTH=293 /DNA_ID=CAMNT_0008535419 /DNA_START=322 /DNA_END=1203 /DNA_ORIENTATION=+